MSNDPTKKPVWNTLEQHAQDIQSQHLNDLFSQDPERFEKFSFEFNDVFFDYSKQAITDDILQDLLALVKSYDIKDKIQDMYDGKPINMTEGRSVLHTALRRPKGDTVEVNGENVISQIHETLEKMKVLSEQLSSGAYTSATNKKIENIVSIGIGGSDLGPRMVYKALSNKPEDVNIPCHFVSNIDGDDINHVLNLCDPETTLVIIISKTFTTQETLTNAQIAIDWFKEKLGDDNNIIAQHFIGVSASPETAVKFGIAADNIFPFWEWVNGRFSLWSAVGLPIALSLGFEAFENLLAGAHEVDNHFIDTPLEQNIPVLMALIGIWNRNFLKYSNHAILPYAQRLEHFSNYLQQLEMESNGKSVDIEGNTITDYETGAIYFGVVGTNGQHSFYQLLHQGSDTIPCDFIAAINPDNDLKESHTLLLSHMLAQGQALMQGKQDNKADEPYRYFEGNKPSTTLLFKELNARTLGMLLALYEHKIFVQGIVWNINSFDQFGVELGKELSKKLATNDLSQADNSTKGLFSYIHKSSQ